MKRKLVYLAENISKIPLAVQTNEALGYAFRTASLAKFIGLKGGKPIISPNFSRFTGLKTFVQTGYKEYGGAIKGHAALGYYATYMDSIGKNFSDSKLLRKKEVFFQEHGIENSLEFNEKVSKDQVLLWDIFRERAMVCPSSGSFSYGFLETLRKLRSTNIQVGNNIFPLFGDDDGKVVPFLPHPGLVTISPAEKSIYVAKAALEIKCMPEYWLVDRDIISFIYAIEKRGFYCSTNPKSIEEVKQLLEEVGKRTGPEFFEKHRETLEDMGVEVIKNNGTLTIKVNKPMSGSIYGLMVAKLDAMEAIAADATIKEETTFNQPSAGSTLAASALVNIILARPQEISAENITLFKEYFPNLYQAAIIEKKPIKSNLYGCFDTANPALAKQLGYNGIAYPNNGNPVNGLGSFSSSDESVRWLNEAASLPNPSFSGGSSMLVCPHNTMQIARTMLFADSVSADGVDALYPESAGAAGLGGWLHQQIIEGKKNAKDVAYFLRDKGVSRENFDKLVDIDDFIAESKQHGGKMIEFSAEFLQAMSPTVPIESLRPRSYRQETIDTTKALVFINTGSNGTEKQQKYAVDIIRDRQKHQSPQMQLAC